MINKKLIVLSVAITMVCSIFAQDASKGWSQVQKGDLNDAKKTFSKALKADSSDQKALLGAMYLSDISHDTRVFERLARKLIRTSPSDAYFQTFFDEFFSDEYGSGGGYEGGGYGSRNDLGTNDVAADMDFSDTDIDWMRENAQVPIRYKMGILVDDVFDKKKYTKTYATLVEALSPYFDNQGWSYIGPFKNINGAGFNHVYGPESDGFMMNKGKQYDDGLGKKIGWFTPPYIKPLGMLFPSDNIPSNSPATMYYAHRNFGIDQETSIFVNISRNQPLKVWIDGKIIFGSNDARGVMLDDERVEIRLSAGSHRMTVKMAPYSPEVNRQTAFELLGADPDNKGGSAGFCVRMTDKDGKIIPVRKAKNSDSPGTLLKQSGVIDPVLDPLMAKAKDGTAEPHELYVLARLALIKSRSKEGEATFYFLNKKKPDALVKALLATQYARNGNQVKVYETLKKFDNDDFPHFALAARKLENTDPEVDRDLFEKRLEYMQEIALSNPEIIAYYLQYYAGREDTIKVEDFKKKVLKSYPDYEEMLEEYGEFNNLKGYSYFNFDKYRKRRRRKNKTLDRVEDMLALRPDMANGYEGMATYLEEKKEDLPGALAMVNDGLKIAPYEKDLLLKKANLFLEMNKKDSALAVYRLIKKRNTYRNYGGYGMRGGDLDQKIENLAGTKNQDDSEFFESIGLDEILEQKAEWEDRYAKEDAVVLLNHKNMLLKEDGEMKSWHKFIVLVNNEAGVQSWTSSYFSEMGRNIVAQVRKADGSFYQPEVRGSAVVAQNLQPGDMLIVDGISSRQTLSMHRQFGVSESFSYFEAFEYTNPVYSQKITLALPEDYPIEFMTHHLEQAESSQETKDKLDYYRWEMTHVPAYVEEEASLGKWIGSPKIQASNGLSWTDVSSWYQDMTYRKLEPNYIMQELHDSLVTEGMNKTEIIESIYRYITHDIQYVSSFLQDGYEPQRPEVTCSSGVGDCKDVATLMITLLRMSGIKADYTLVLSNAYVPFKVLPINFFNHAIVAYEHEGQTHYVDLTTERYPYYAIPEPDQGAWALLIKPGKQDIFRLPMDQLNTDKNLVEYTVKANMPDTATVIMDVKALYPGNEGGRMREFMGAQGKNTAAYYRSELTVQGLPELQLKDLEYDNLEDFDDPLKFDVDFVASDAAENLYGLHVMTIPCLDRGPIPSALLTPERYRMLDLSQVLTVAPVKQTVTLTFPEGYKLFRTPPPAEVKSRFGSYTLTFTKVDGGVKIEKFQTFNHTKIAPEDYPDFREFFYKTNKLDRTKLVFIKKGLKLEIE
ncbi:MAG: transglutaminase domain-containing protein [Bacteroidia bacterium]